MRRARGRKRGRDLAVAGGGHRHRRLVADAGRRGGARNDATLAQEGRSGDGDHGRVCCDHGTGGLSSRGVPSRDSRMGKCAGAISKCTAAVSGEPVVVALLQFYP